MQLRQSHCYSERWRQAHGRRGGCRRVRAVRWRGGCWLAARRIVTRLTRCLEEEVQQPITPAVLGTTAIATAVVVEAAATTAANCTATGQSLHELTNARITLCDHHRAGVDWQRAQTITGTPHLPIGGGSVPEHEYWPR